jgi:cyclic pyranopterin phosphate synthase
MIERIDNHKLIYHPKRVSDWLEGKNIYPIYAEISLTSACNHRCMFCAPRFYLNYKPIFMDTQKIKDTILNMSSVGIKAIMFGGEGEPLLHKDFMDIVDYSKSCGIDVALTTNGSLFDKKVAERLLPKLSWVKFSIDAGNSILYSKLHGTSEEQYKTVLDNLSRASFIKRLKKYNVKIGAQSILFKENIDTLCYLAKLLKYLKPDYFVVKPYSRHPKSTNEELNNPTKEQIDIFLKSMEQYKEDYKFIYRENAFINLDKEKTYDICYGQDFIVHIDTLGGVYSCINYIGESDFCYGNIYKDSFENIWKNKKFIKPNIDKCRTVCRLDNINRYLWDLKNPINDVNFI